MQLGVVPKSKIGARSFLVSQASLQAAAQVRSMAEEEAPVTIQEANQKLLRLVAILRKCSTASIALADVLTLLANTKTFFAAAKFEPVRAAVSGAAEAAEPASGSEALPKGELPIPGAGRREMRAPQ